MAFLFRLETRDGAAADPPTLTSAVPELELGRHDPARCRQDAARGSTFRDDDAEQTPALVVEDTAG
jgi:hypothetical protein